MGDPLKIVLAGEAGVGKSSILLRFTDNTYTDNYIATIGADFKLGTVEVNKEKRKVQVWDTAGQERFRSITSSYYRGADGVVIVFDIANRDSFQKLKSWIDGANTEPNDITKVLAGNKMDLEKEREVSIEEARSYAQQNGLEYVEVSAKTGENVGNLFVQIATKACQKQQNAKDPNSFRLKNDEPPGENKGKPGGCCN